MSIRRIWAWVCAHTHARRAAPGETAEPVLARTLEERRVEVERDIRQSRKEVEWLLRQWREDRR